MVTVEEEHDFEWKCRKCGSHGYVCSDVLWKYCPYCGSELEIHEENYEEASE